MKMKATSVLTPALALALALLGCGDTTAQPEIEPPDPLGQFVYGVTPGFSAAPRESLELYRDAADLQLLVFVDGQFEREVLGELTPSAANSLDELAEALRSGETELGGLNLGCGAGSEDAPRSTLRIENTQLELSYPSPCPPSGVAGIHAILDDIAYAFAACEPSTHATFDSCG